MKISIITRHAISNYGSFFQTYATQKTFEKLGCEAEIIDYVRTDEHHRNVAKVQLKKSNWNNNFLSRIFYYCIKAPEYYIMGQKFLKFRKQEFKLSKNQISSYEQLKKEKLDADIFCTGSDQVWGPIGGDKFDQAYFLTFVENKKCIAYAASFGKTSFEEDTLNCVDNYLKKYDDIAVREKSALEIISGLGFNNVSQVLDPTLLLDKSEWSKMIDKDISGKYILVYQIHSNPNMDKYAVQFAKKVNLPLIRISPLLHQFNRGGKFKYLPELGQWLSYVKNATYMITDSFHGTAFAINFGTQFINISPGLTATRNMSILELTGLEDRMLKSYDNFNMFDKKIDYKVVHQKIEVERQKSINWLKKAIKEE